MADQAQMIARIRAALGGRTGEVTPLEGLPRKTSSARQDQLAARFTEELQKAGGSVEHVEASDEIADRIAALAEARAAKRLAVSDGAESAAPGLRKTLSDVIGEGLELIPTLRELSPSLDPALIPAEAYKRELIDADAGVTTADYAIADTGTLVLVSGGEQHRLISLVPPAHFCILKRSAILPDLAELISRVHDGPYSGTRPPLVMTFITGPSRTADIELTLTMGVHGPRELCVLLCP